MLELRPLHGDIGGLHLRRLQLSPCLCHIRLRRSAAFESPGRKLQGFVEGFNRVVEKTLLGIGAAQLEIIEGQLRLKTQPGGLQVGSASLGFLAGRGDASADTAPQVDLVRYIAGQKKLAAGCSTRRRSSGCSTRRSTGCSTRRRSKGSDRRIAHRV